MDAPLTSTVRTPVFPDSAFIPADAHTGLSTPSIALFSQIRTVDRARLGTVNAETMKADEAIQVAFGLSIQ